ncbi:MAG: LuxR C-terminal-related transcriptional regulator, partial [Spirochaetota bacterium]
MTRLAVLSRSDTFHRQIWNASKEREGVRVELRLRSFEEAGGLRDIDVLIVHDPGDNFPSPDDSRWSELPPLVVVRNDPPGPEVHRLGELQTWLADGTDAQAILIAAEATAQGFVVTDPALRHSVSSGGVGVSAASIGGDTTTAGSGAGPLTARELEVLVLLAAGNTNQKIADDLGITSNTVKYHLAGIYGALDVST